MRDDGHLQRWGLSDTLDGGGVEKRDSESPGFCLEWSIGIFIKIGNIGARIGLGERCEAFDMRYVAFEVPRIYPGGIYLVGSWIQEWER